MAHHLPAVLATDAMGCISVIRDGAVERRLGNPDPKRRIRSASLEESNAHPPVLAVSRIDGSIQLMNPANGNVYYDSGLDDERKNKSELHLFRRQPGSSRLLYCAYRRAVIATYDVTDGSFSPTTHWDADVMEIGSTAIDNTEHFCVFSGKTNGNLKMWDIETRNRIWNWKSEETRKASIVSDPHFPYAKMNAITFQGADHNVLLCGTNHSKLWSFDIRGPNRPNRIQINNIPRGSPINALQMDNNGIIVYFATGCGLMGQVDTRGGVGVIGDTYFAEPDPISGGINSIAKHPQQPLLASSGLDGYVRVWNINSNSRSSLVSIARHRPTSVFFSTL